MEPALGAARLRGLPRTWGGVLASEAPTLEVRRLGMVAYQDALELQSDLVGARRSGEIPDTLVLLEHPHVITLGSSSDPEHVLLAEHELVRRGIEKFEIGRGGDVTYHGPGQLVAYPVLDLKPDRKDLHAYLRHLESVLLMLASRYDIRAERSEGLTGIWAPRGKLAAIGVRVSSGWITSHGLALNVDTDLSYFDTIVPCGIRDREVTSLSRELGRPVDVEEASYILEECFRDVFGYRIPVG